MPSLMQRKARCRGMNPTKITEKEKLAQARAVKRAERVVAKRADAEKHKETGNVHFRAGDYHKAIEEYDAAVKIHGPNAAFFSNMAAAWLKLEEYPEAETCAQRALDIDPSFMKARYRRGLARKGNLELARAAVDFKTILTQDPNSTEAKAALVETYTLLYKRKHTNEDDYADSDDELPRVDDIKLEVESASDSSDWNHEGNGIACKFYNRDGCLRGSDCRFSHAPDHKSVRDRLGRNVCMYFLLGTCSFSSSACIYSHDKTYLPPGRWWGDEEKCNLLRAILDSLSPGEKSSYMPYMATIMDDRLAWAPAHGVEMEEVFGHDRPLGRILFGVAADKAVELLVKKSEKESKRDGPSSGLYVLGNSSGIRLIDKSDEVMAEMEERMANLGFTEDEVMELACQGVKPWDDDAWDVLNALNSL